METIKKIFVAVVGWAMLHKKISSAIFIAIALIVCGIIFGVKIKGCIDSIG